MWGLACNVNAALDGEARKQMCFDLLNQMYTYSTLKNVLSHTIARSCKRLARVSDYQL